MFGYVTPCIMELKMKDYEKFKAYYCSLCRAIKEDFGNIPRLALNYDMTFLCILLDALDEKNNKFEKGHCFLHPFKHKVFIKNNPSVHYAALCNVLLTYYKLKDNVDDDKSLKSDLGSKILNIYISKSSKAVFLKKELIESKLSELSDFENNFKDISLDELAHPFAELTAYIISSYYENKVYNKQLYQLGYNLGKWIYIIDAWDDLEKDLKSNKFNAINAVYNKNNLSYEELFKEMETRIDFILTTCARTCFENLNGLKLYKNQDILYNILQFGMIEKMDKVFKRQTVKSV